MQNLWMVIVLTGQEENIKFRFPLNSITRNPMNVEIVKFDNESKNSQFLFLLFFVLFLFLF